MKTHGEKIMAWSGFAGGRCLPVVWFNGSVNGDKYLNDVLKGTIWLAVRNIAIGILFSTGSNKMEPVATSPLLVSTFSRINLEIG